MIVLVFFAVVILFSLLLNAIDKIMAYKEKDHTVWEDGDSVIVKDNKPHKTTNFCRRIA